MLSSDVTARPEDKGRRVLDFSRFNVIPDVLEECIKRHPDSPAMEWVAEGQVRQVTYREIYNMVRELSVAMSREPGLRSPGEAGAQDFVTVHAEYGMEISPAWWSTLANGGIFAGIADSQNLAQVFGDLKPRVSILHNLGYLERFTQAYPSLPFKPERVILLTGEKPKDSPIQGLLTLAEMRAKGREILKENPNAYADLVARLKPASFATLTTTSGSSGEPKAFLFNHQGMIRAAQVLTKEFRKNFDLPDNCALLNGAYPSDDIFSFFTLLIAEAGDRSFIFQNRDREQIFQSLKIKGPQLWFMTPQLVYDINRGFQNQLTIQHGEKVCSFIYRLASEVGYKYYEANVLGTRKLTLKEKLVFGLCKAVVYKKLYKFLGGEFFGTVVGSQKLDHRALGIMGGCSLFRVRQNYGTREVGAIGFGLNNIYEFIDDIEFQLVTEDGKVYERESITKSDKPIDGVLKVKTPGMAVRYFPDTRPIVDDNGFFDTGDIVRITPDLKMEFLGRHKFWIYDNGAETKFNPEDVEGLLKVINGVVNAILVSRFEHAGAYVPQFPTTNRSLVGVLASNLTYEELLPRVLDVNKKVPRRHRMADFIVVPAAEWEAGKGLVTESVKPRRALICARYEKALDEVYLKIDKNGGKPLLPGVEE